MKIRDNSHIIWIVAFTIAAVVVGCYLVHDINRLQSDNTEHKTQNPPIIKRDTIVQTSETQYILPEETDDVDELRSALDNAYEKIQELEDKIEIAQSMIDDARSKIEDARFDIDGARLLRDKTLLDDAEIGLDDASSELDDAEIELQQ